MLQQEQQEKMPQKRLSEEYFRRQHLALHRISAIAIVAVSIVAIAVGIKFLSVSGFDVSRDRPPIINPDFR